MSLFAEFFRDQYVLYSLAACATMVASTAYYIVTILRGDTRPSRSSYWIWFGLGALILASYLLSGGSDWMLKLTNTACAFVLALLSLRYGEGEGLGRCDHWCIRIAASSVLLWLVLSVFVPMAEAALIVFGLQMLADLVGSVPTVAKCWDRPHSESLSSWVVTIAAYAVNTQAVRAWTPQDYVWTALIGLSCVVIVVILSLRPRFLAASPET